VIGDALSDIEAGTAIGARTFRVGPAPLPSLLDIARELAAEARAATGGRR
jgi:hypothetical protein